MNIHLEYNLQHLKAQHIYKDHFPKEHVDSAWSYLVYMDYALADQEFNQCEHMTANLLGGIASYVSANIHHEVLCNALNYKAVY